LPTCSSFTWLALQGFGGVLAVIQREMVERKRWLTQEEFWKTGPWRKSCRGRMSSTCP
jgi:hypothetical protein